MVLSQFVLWYSLVASSLGCRRRCTNHAAPRPPGSFLPAALNRRSNMRPKAGRLCVHLLQRAAWSFAKPSLEEKPQTLTKEKGCVEGESTGLPPTPEVKTIRTTEENKTKRKTKRNVEGRKPAELTTLRVNFSKEVLRPCSLSGFRGKKKKGREKNTEKKNLQLTCGFQTAAAAANEQERKQTVGEKRAKRSSQCCVSQWERWGQKPKTRTACRG